jgi:capsular polysaccharide transport system ATP-binding protein
MIVLQDVCKSYAVTGAQVSVLNNINLTVKRGDRLGILGGNGAGKSTLVRIIAGIERQSSGTVTRGMSVSWPLAFSGAFQSSLTGLDNLRFICRVYGVQVAEVIDFVEDFSQLGRFLREPLKVYSSGMRARLAFAVSMMIDFDCYLIDEVVAVGDARFQARSHEELIQKRPDRTLIIVSHDPHYIRYNCNRAAVLERGNLYNFQDVESALAYHEASMLDG